MKTIVNSNFIVYRVLLKHASLCMYMYFVYDFHATITEMTAYIKNCIAHSLKDSSYGIKRKKLVTFAIDQWTLTYISSMDTLHGNTNFYDTFRVLDLE